MCSNTIPHAPALVTEDTVKSAFETEATTIEAEAMADAVAAERLKIEAGIPGASFKMGASYVTGKRWSI